MKHSSRPADLSRLQFVPDINDLLPAATRWRAAKRLPDDASPEDYYKIDVAISLAMLAYRLGRTIHFDPAAEKIVGDDEAARLAKPEYRGPWKFPQQYL